MRVLIQRVSQASVIVGESLVSEISFGLLIFLCAMHEDTELDVEKIAAKAAKLRIFNDENDKMNKSIIDVGGEALIVSQFTLAADTTRGNRPGFSSAAPPDRGEELYEYFVKVFERHGIRCKQGVFGGDMNVSLVNNGPTTIWIDSRD